MSKVRTFKNEVLMKSSHKLKNEKNQYIKAIEQSSISIIIDFNFFIHGPVEAYTSYTKYRGPGLRGARSALNCYRDEQEKGKKRKKKGKKKGKKRRKFWPQYKSTPLRKWFVKPG